MDLLQIKDRDHLKAWLKTRSQRDRVVIAHRAAMRVAPLWMNEYQPPLNVRGSNIWMIDLFQSLFTTGAAAFSATSEIKRAANGSIERAMAIHPIPTKIENRSTDVGEAFIAAIWASKSMLYDDPNIASDNAANAIISSALAADMAYAAENELLIACIADIDAVEKGLDSLAYPLWNGVNGPFARNWAIAHKGRALEGSEWDFWVRWYDAALRGQPLNWKMQEEIALLPSELWEGDVSALAAAIAAIELKFSLLDQISDLREKLNELIVHDQFLDPSLPQRWHNNPPELVETVVRVRDKFTLVSQAIDDAESELQKSNPQPLILQKIGKILFEAGKAILIYCGKLADVALQSAVKEIASTGIKALIAVAATSWLAQSEPIQSIGKSIMELAAKLESGG